ncbi:MAG: ankyrin repeat domain-containing protein [Phenylobacterium sp.]|uniref:ankyrin repeat domain-containing protein n=1 Tax=Phenylobacterium sp. TaxID=1871053 RepID=UPI001A3722ED|nr:ankyrin repeat domain-containing protein [Phenylobacterium sp.]MBL8553235.1 ankyrin repeat domain-containing protein [Phenylobacterium sp.]
MASKTRLTDLVKAFDTAAMLADLDAKPDLLGVRDERGRTWLHLIAAQPAQGDAAGAAASIALAEGLIARGLDMDDAAFTEGPDGAWRATPLWFAISRGRNLPLAGWLLERGCDPDHCLFAAAWNHDVEAIRLLRRHGAPLRPAILLEAIGWSRFDAAEEFVRQGCDPNAAGGDGRTALHMMLKKDSPPERMAALIALGARTDIPGPDGRTAADILRRKKDPAYRALADASLPPPRSGGRGIARQA